MADEIRAWQARFPATYTGCDYKHVRPLDWNRVTDSAVREILDAVDHVPELYYRLVLVVAPAGSGKTTALRDVADRSGWRYINVNLELSRRLVEFTDRQRRTRTNEVLNEIIDGGKGQAVVLDNTELLFEESLKLDPLKTLQLASRRRNVVAAWNGHLRDGYLSYAEPGHDEYRRYPAGDLTTVNLVEVG